VIDTIGTRKGLLPLMAPNAKQYMPHIVLVMIGTNDINDQLEVATAPDRLASLIDDTSAAAPDALVVVAQLIPTRTDSLNVEVQAYNAAIPAMVSARANAGKHITTVDMYSAFTANPNYKNALLFDGLHPNDAGYALMAQVWYRAISKYLQ
jgi:lysophospholipase L1-like esterase